MEMIPTYLAAFGRRLDAAQLERFSIDRGVALEQALALEELRCVSRFEELDGAIDRLASVEGIRALANLAIDRVTSEFGSATERTLTALALAPDGLNEALLKLASGEIDAPTPDLKFVLLRRSLEGLASFSPERIVLRSAALSDHVLDRFAPDGGATARREIVARLKREPEQAGAAEELIRLQIVLRDWDGLLQTLTNASAFDALARRSRQRLRAAWSRLRDARPELGPSLYLAWRYEASPRRVAEAASLALDIGDASSAALLAEDAYDRARVSDPLAFVLAAEVLTERTELCGEFDRAETLLVELSDPALVAVAPCLWSRALTRRARLALLRRGPAAATAEIDAAEAAACESKDVRLQAVLSDLRGSIAVATEDLCAARKVFETLRATGDRLADLAILAAAETGLARVARASGKAREPGDAIARALRFARVVGDGRLLQDALGVAAKVFIEDLNYDQATRLIIERRALTKRMGDIIGQLEAEVDWARVCKRTTSMALGERIEAGVKAAAKRYGFDFLPF
jgi:hypothetical protein